MFRKSLALLFFLFSYMLIASIKVQAPHRLLLHFNDAYLAYDVINNTSSIAIHEDIISKGGNWEIVRPSNEPYIYHVREKKWKDFFWRINILLGKVFRVTNGYFSGYGEDYKAKEEEVNIKLESEGNPDNPKYIFLRISDVNLVYEPKDNYLRIIAQSDFLDDGKQWKIKALKRESPISTIKREVVTGYHLKSNLWNNFYWEVDITKKKVYRVKGGEFGKGGGNFEQLDIVVEVVE